MKDQHLFHSLSLPSKVKYLLLAVFLIELENANSQVFTDITPQNNIAHTYGDLYGTGASFVDFNGDGWDDLSVCQSGQNELQFYINENGTLMPIDLEIYYTGNTKQMSWVDFDNDGDKDLFITGEQASCKLYENLGEFNFVDISLEAGFPETSINTNGHSWGDFDKDGLLDVFICNYEDSYSNWFFQQNEDGSFTDITEEKGFSIHMEYSFQSVFCDFNNDGWSDLFVINDRYVHTNRLYLNLEGDFLDVTETSGLEYYINSMSNTVADFNRDGWHDVYVTNSNGNLLFKNLSGNTFTEIALGANVFQLGFSWGASFIDFDNNSLLDLVVCTAPVFAGSGMNKLLVNNGNETFSLEPNSGISDLVNYSYSAPIGDLDNDGYYDLLITGGNNSTTRLYSNTSSGNNYMKVSLEGVISNRDGIGSLIEIFHNGTYQCKYTLCGEGYLNQNSTNHIFGIGTDSIIDTLRVTWLSGITDTFYNLIPNNTIHVSEGQSIDPQIQAQGNISLCPGDSITLSAGLADGYLWSTGHTEPSITVSDGGLYYVQLNFDGLNVYSDTISINILPPPAINANYQNISCFGNEDGQIVLINNNGNGILEVNWNNGMQGDSITDLSAGGYHYSVLDFNGCEASGYVNIFEPDSLHLYLTATNQSEFADGAAEIQISGGVPPYFIEWSTGEDETSVEGLSPGDYTVTVIDVNGCIATQNFHIDAYTLIHENYSKLKFEVYPNPATDVIHVEGLSKDSRLTLHTLDGQLVWEIKANSSRTGKESISLKDISQGFYLLEIRNHLKIERIKIMKR